jgi:hypothetical protein
MQKICRDVQYVEVRMIYNAYVNEDGMSLFTCVAVRTYTEAGKVPGPSLIRGSVAFVCSVRISVVRMLGTFLEAAGIFIGCGSFEATNKVVNPRCCGMTKTKLANP